MEELRDSVASGCFRLSPELLDISREADPEASIRCLGHLDGIHQHSSPLEEDTLGLCLETTWHGGEKWHCSQVVSAHCLHCLVLEPDSVPRQLT